TRHRQVTARPDSTSPAPPSLDAEMVVAVYRALLGRAPDADGLTEDTDEDREGLADVGHRLLATDGLGRLDHRPPSPAVLRTLPWSEVPDRWGRLPALVLGPYGRELADEVVRRGCIGVARAGLSAAGAPSWATAGTGGPGAAIGDRRGTLVLTDELYVRALSRLRPDVIDGTVLRLLHPVGTRMGEGPEERGLRVLAARRRLHLLGFVEVSQVVGRRYGGEPVVLDTSFAMPVPGELLTVPGATVPDGQTPSAVWLVARRVPAGDRA
ncbi:hypothetical protein, partial [Blastococcus sp. CT_GayMR20]|uniref:hypothetical protein n=1 Tax=Blastococcus sp. CT_GayMR20 TaxID=2559609 RepID=UPI001ADDC34F